MDTTIQGSRAGGWDYSLEELRNIQRVLTQITLEKSRERASLQKTGQATEWRVFIMGWYDWISS